MNKILTLLIAFAACMTAWAEGPVVEGTSYYLPKTAVRFTLRIEKTTFTPGELAEYASKYFMQGEAVMAPMTSYRILNMQMDAVGVPDSAKYFSAKMSPKLSIDNVYTNVDGLLLSVNKEPKMPMEPQIFVPAPKPEPLNPRDFMSQEILSVGSKTKLAQLCAKEVFDIREARNELSRGQAEITPKDGEQLRLMMETMDRQERALSSLFNGVTEKDTLEEVIVFCASEEVEKQVLFRFSDVYGLCDADDLAGAPYYITVKDLHKTPEDTRTPKEIAAQKDLTGLFVNVPGYAHVTVWQQERKWVEKDYQYAQFGRLENVSQVLFGKKVKTTYEVNPVTGAMMHMESAGQQ